MEEEKVSGCCGADMVPPEDEEFLELVAGSLWRAYSCYICKGCHNPCEPVNKN